MIPTVIFPAALKTHNITVRRSDPRHTLETAFGITATLERVLEPVQTLEHLPRYPGFLFAVIGAFILSVAWIRMFQTSSMVDFLEWCAIGVGFFMLALVRKSWVEGLT